MAHHIDYEAILAVIEAAIKVARRNPTPGALIPTNVMLQEFCRGLEGTSARYVMAATQGRILTSPKTWARTWTDRF